PPGDIRNCLIALARVAPEVSAALQYRFDGGAAQHPVGNLLLAALDMVATDEVTAIRLAAELLGVDDLVLPSTTHRVHLVADLLDGRSVAGESEIPRSGAPIKRVRLDPPDAASAPGVLEALHAADAIILGPGSLYTSLLATLVVPGVVEAVTRSRAVRIFVCNAMTERGETDGYGVAEHLRALDAHGLPPEALDYVVVSTTPIPSKIRARYVGERVLIVGTSALARQIIKEIERRPDLRYAVVGVVDDAENLGRVVEATRPDRIVVALAERRQRLPFYPLLEARARGILVEDAAETYERLTGKLA